MGNPRKPQSDWTHKYNAETGIMHYQDPDKGVNIGKESLSTWEKIELGLLILLVVSGLALVSLIIVVNL